MGILWIMAGGHEDSEGDDDESDTNGGEYDDDHSDTGGNEGDDGGYDDWRL